MATVRARQRKDGTTSYTVTWRAGGTRAGTQESEPFDDPEWAAKFRQLVDEHGQQWPTGWVKGHGFVAVETKPDVVLFADWAERHIAHLTGIQRDTRRRYRRQVALHLNPTFGHLDVREITAEHVAAWVNTYEGRRAPKTIANLHGLLYAILQGAVETEPALRPSNPCTRTTLPRLDGGDGDEEMVFLTPQEFSVILAAIGEDARDLLELLVGTGLRWGEVSALQVGDLDLLADQPTLRVRRAWKTDDDGRTYLGPPKSKASRRTLTLDRRQVDLLAGHVTGKRPKDFVFCHTDQRPGRDTPKAWLYNTFLTGRWWPALHAVVYCDEHRPTGRRADQRRPTPCGCPGTLDKTPRIHDLRHTHVAWLIAANVPLTLIQRRLGHESIVTTSDRYGHLLPELDGRVSAATTAALGRVDGPGGGLGPGPLPAQSRPKPRATLMPSLKPES